MPFRSEKQRRYLWKNNPEIARKWTNEHGSTPVKAKKGKYQELEHPDHEIKPIEHKEENVSSKERVEKLLDERKTKKETKKKLVKQGTGYVPGWRPNLSVKATEGGPIKARKGIDIQKKSALNRIKYSSKWDKSLKNRSEIWKRAKETARDRLTLWDIRNAQKTIQGEKKQLESVVDVRSKGGPIKAKKGLWTGAKTNTFEAPSGWDAKKISDKTGKKLDRLFKYRERGGYKQATDYKKYLTTLGKMQKAPLSGTSTTLPPKTARLLSQLKFAYKQTPKAKALAILKKLGRKTHIGKAVAAATVAAGAYEAGKRKLFAKDKKKVTKKSIGGETVVMKSGGGYINDLL